MGAVLVVLVVTVAVDTAGRGGQRSGVTLLGTCQADCYIQPPLKLFRPFATFDYTKLMWKQKLPPWREERSSKNIFDLTELENAPRRTRSSEQI